MLPRRGHSLASSRGSAAASASCSGGRAYGRAIWWSGGPQLLREQPVRRHRPDDSGHPPQCSPGGKRNDTVDRNRGSPGLTARGSHPERRKRKWNCQHHQKHWSRRSGIGPARGYRGFAFDATGSRGERRVGRQRCQGAVRSPVSWSLVHVMDEIHLSVSRQSDRRVGTVRV